MKARKVRVAFICGLSDRSTPHRELPLSFQVHPTYYPTLRGPIRALKADFQSRESREMSGIRREKMRQVRLLLIVFAVLCVQPSASSQTVSGTSFITGFELGSLAEGSATGGSVQSAVVRSGSYAYRANPIHSNQYIGFVSRSAGGGLRQVFRSSRFYLRIEQLPLNGSVSIVKIGGAATFNPEVDLNWDGTLVLADSWYPAIAKSQNALTRDGLWHRVEFDVGYGLRVYVDGVLWASGGTTTS